MPRRQVTHLCSKETEIALIKQRQEQDHKMIVEMHTFLLGDSNVNNGLNNRMTKLETGQDNLRLYGKIFAWFVTIGLTLLAIFKK